MLRHTRDGTEEVNGALKRSGKETGTGEEQIANTGGLEVKDAGRPGSFDDFKVDGIKK